MTVPVNQSKLKASGDVELIQGNSVKLEKIEWIWDGWFPRGKLVILAGHAGTGKTTIMLSIAAILSVGSTLPDGAKAEAGSVVIWSGEDDIADTLAPRLIAMGANMSNIFFVNGKGSRPFDPSIDMPDLSKKMESLSDVKMVIVDPVVSAINGDSYKNVEVRKSLAPLVELGKKTKACIVGITHFNKVGATYREPLDLISGSIAFAAVARVVLGAAKLPAPDEYGHSRIFCRIKSNIGPDEDGFGYDLCCTFLKEQPDIEASMVSWGAYVEGHSRELILQVQSVEKVKFTALNEAEEFLKITLSDRAVASNEIFEKAKLLGISERTVRRAKESLKIDDFKETGKNGQWYWKLSEDARNTTFPNSSSENLG